MDHDCDVTSHVSFLETRVNAAKELFSVLIANSNYEGSIDGVITHILYKEIIANENDVLSSILQACNKYREAQRMYDQYLLDYLKGDDNGQ